MHILEYPCAITEWNDIEYLVALAYGAWLWFIVALAVAEVGEVRESQESKRQSRMGDSGVSDLGKKDRRSNQLVVSNR